MDRDIELTRILDNLKTAKSGAEVLDLELLQYLIDVALDEAREVVAKGKTGTAFGAALGTRKSK